MKTWWNIFNAEQRKELIYKIYNNNFFFYICEKNWDEIPYGVRCRLERLATALDI
jgi:hypothetical protein